MTEPRKVNLQKFTATSVTRQYHLRHKVTGEYAFGIFYKTVLESVPGKKRKQKVSKPFVCGSTDRQYTLDIEDVNNIINKAIHRQISYQLDDFELLTVDRVVGIVSVGKLDLQKKKQNAEMAALATKLRE